MSLPGRSSCHPKAIKAQWRITAPQASLSCLRSRLLGSLALSPAGARPPKGLQRAVFLIRIVLADPLRSAFHEALYVVLVDSQLQMVEFCIVYVIVADSSSAREALSPFSASSSNPDHALRIPGLTI